MKRQSVRNGKNVDSILYVLAEAWQYRKTFFGVYLVDIIISSIQPFFSIYFTKQLLDEFAGERNLRRIIFFAIGLVGCNLLINLVLAWTKENIIQDYNNDFSKYFEAKLGYKVMQIEYSNLENPEILNKLEKAKRGMSFHSGGVGGVTRSLAIIISNILTIIGTTGILIQYSPVILIAVVFVSSVSALINKEINKIQLRFFDKLTEKSRASTYIMDKLSNFTYGKDFRLYSAENMMLRKADEYNMETVMILKKQSRDISKHIVVTKICMSLLDGTIFLIYGYSAILKSISIGTFSMLLSSANTFKVSINNAIVQIQELIKKRVYINEYVEFMSLPEPKHEGALVCNSDGLHNVEFKNVYFSYPGTKDNVLNDISLKIEAGEHIAIVGLNGAGKTTFIKLLCRLYRQTSGEILIDGINIQDYSFEEYTKLLSVVFQDFKLLPFSVKENIALDCADKANDSKLWEIVKKVGIKHMIDILSDGIDTNIYRTYDRNGYEPSGGEQQKIATARALYKNSPIVILDEPTAALDPIAEYEVYSNFEELVRGKTAILISHRLSSCRICDKIIVFEKGKMVECGTHEELMGIKNGVYAEMFRTQSKYYV